MDKKRAFHARVHILMAYDSDVAVAIRRGPSKSVCTVLWNRKTDKFKVGQWMRGRIYERRSDISPDGKHLIYFAMNGRWESEVKGAWTAISRAPYLKAITLYPKGDCWQGGGLFTSSSKYWLNQSPERIDSRGDLKLSRDTKFQPERFGSECTGVYYVRLIRDGWKLKENFRRDPLHAITAFEKPLAGGLVLLKLAHEQVGSPAGKGCYWDEHRILNSTSETRLSFPDWEWAESEGNKVWWVSQGKLWKAYAHKAGLRDEKMLFDFTPLEFEAIEAPY